MESILQVLASGFKDRKEIIKMRKTTTKVGDSDERIIAILSDGKLQELNKAERVSRQDYLTFKSKLKGLDKEKEDILEKFKKTIKDIDYTEIDFSVEIKELNKISKLSIYKISELSKNSYYSLFGSEDNYSKYEENIKKNKKSLELLKNNHEVYL